MLDHVRPRRAFPWGHAADNLIRKKLVRFLQADSWLDLKEPGGAYEQRTFDLVQNMPKTNDFGNLLFPQQIVEGLLNSWRRVSDRPS